jgi:hypothetical protein
MVRIGIEASERIGLAYEAEAVAGPAVMSVPPQCRQRPLNAGQILAATVRYWPSRAAGGRSCAHRIVTEPLLPWMLDNLTEYAGYLFVEATAQ